MQGGRRLNAVAIGALLSLLGGVGCFHTQQIGPDNMQNLIQVPPAGEVPRELDKMTFPPYVIEAPDQLLIEVIQRSEVPDPDVPMGKKKAVDRLPIQPISGPFQVRLDGTVGLGFWGNVPVAGLTMEQAADSIKKSVVANPVLADFHTKPESVIVILDVLAYNSKRYYIIFDQGGFGEQVISFPITGSETVLDAISNAYGLPDVSSKRNIWVARRTPHPGQPWQILPVDWVGMTQRGITTTNYQIMPGDRIYVKAQKLVTIDHTLARILAPFERVLGITLLGSSTVNQISGKNLNGTGQ